MSSGLNSEPEPQIAQEKVEEGIELKVENHEIKNEAKRDLIEEDSDNLDSKELGVNEEKQKEEEKSENLVEEIQSKGEESKEEVLKDASDSPAEIRQGEEEKIDDDNVEQLHSKDKDVKDNKEDLEIKEKSEIEVKDSDSELHTKTEAKDPEPESTPSLIKDESEIESVPLFPKDIAENLYHIPPNPIPEHPASLPGPGPGHAFSPESNHPDVSKCKEAQIPELNPAGLPSDDLEPTQEPKSTPSPSGEHPSKRDQYLSQLSSIPEEDHKAFFKSNPDVQLAIEFNYEFNSKQQLVHLDTGASFKFTNQKDYENLGKIVQRSIQNMMTTKYGLNRVQIPINQSPDMPHSYIYISPNFNNPEKQHPKALLLIQGAGAVRPGIWARSVCINESLKTGSMNSFISFANKRGFEVIIFNPNKSTNKRQSIKKNSGLEAHGNYVWKTFIRDNSPKDLYIVGHSCGGISTVSLMKSFWDEFKERVKGIAFTDAVHGYHNFDKEQIEFLRRRAVDWVASRLKLDEKTGKSTPIAFVSSGHSKHEYTTGYARKSIKKFFLQIEERNPYL